MFIISITYISELDQVDKYLEEHISYLNKQYSLGNFLVSGKKVPRTGGIILSSAKTRVELDSIIQQDPFYTAQVASYEIIEFIPTKAAPELECMLKN